MVVRVWGGNLCLRLSTRICSERASVNALSEAEPGKGHLALQGNRRCQPLRVVVDEEVLALNIGSSEGRDIDLLQRRIEHLAYNGCEGYPFLSVRCVLPEPYLPAIATLETVRRGADLRGFGGTRAEVAQRIREGDPKTHQTFWVPRGPVAFCPTANRARSGFQIISSRPRTTCVSKPSSCTRLTVRFFWLGLTEAEVLYRNLEPALVLWHPRPRESVLVC